MVMKTNQSKSPKNIDIKRKPKFVGNKHCLEATQIENEINQLRKNKVNVDSL